MTDLLFRVSGEFKEQGSPLEISRLIRNYFSNLFSDVTAIDYSLGGNIGNIVQYGDKVVGSVERVKLKDSPSPETLTNVLKQEQYGKFFANNSGSVEAYLEITDDLSTSAPDGFNLNNDYVMRLLFPSSIGENIEQDVSESIRDKLGECVQVEFGYEPIGDQKALMIYVKSDEELNVDQFQELFKLDHFREHFSNIGEHNIYRGIEPIIE
jgi:hypothetical protein